MFYLDHTPTDKVKTQLGEIERNCIFQICRRLFFCSNDGFLDWWKTKQLFPDGTRNATLWTVSRLLLQKSYTEFQILTTKEGCNPDNRFSEIRNSIHTFIDQFDQNENEIYGSISSESIYQITGLLFAIQKAAETYGDLEGTEIE